MYPGQGTTDLAANLCSWSPDKIQPIQVTYYVTGNIVQNRNARDHLLQKLHFLPCCTKIFVMLSTNFMVLVLRYWLTSVTFLHCPLASGAASCYHNTCFLWSVSILHTGLAPACWVSSCDTNSLLRSTAEKTRYWFIALGFTSKSHPFQQALEPDHPDNNTVSTPVSQLSIWTESLR